MNSALPHYFLMLDLTQANAGRWRFLLRNGEGTNRIEAADEEPGLSAERLEMLALVRGLEALDQPSRVTVEGCSRHIRHGIEFGLAEWRDNGWRWEFFGQMVPIKNADLWQRLERALCYHQVACRHCRYDPPHRAVGEPKVLSNRLRNRQGLCNSAHNLVKCAIEAIRAIRVIMTGQLWRRMAAGCHAFWNSWQGGACAHNTRFGEDWAAH
jgi:ribonuclease HI